MTNASKHLSLSKVLLCAALALTGCADASREFEDPREVVDEVADRPTLSLALMQESGGKSTVQLRFAKPSEAAGPRVLELRLKLEGLKAAKVSKGAALASAGKELISQTKEPGILRLIAYSSASTAEVGSGVLAELELDHTPGKKGRLTILTDRPLFAPELAQAGLLVGDALDL